MVLKDIFLNSQKNFKFFCIFTQIKTLLLLLKFSAQLFLLKENK